MVASFYHPKKDSFSNNGSQHSESTQFSTLNSNQIVVFWWDIPWEKAQHAQKLHSETKCSRCGCLRWPTVFSRTRSTWSKIRSFHVYSMNSFYVWTILETLKILFLDDNQHRWFKIFVIQVRVHRSNSSIINRHWMMFSTSFYLNSNFLRRGQTK